MKKATMVWLGSAVMALSLLAMASWADEPEPADPVITPDPSLSLVGVSQQTSTSLGGARAGSANVTIKDVSYPVGIYSEPLDLAELPDNFGRFVGTGRSVFDFGNGDMAFTKDEVRYTPTQQNRYSLSVTMTFDGGTGRFWNITGALDGSGTADVQEFAVVTEMLLEGGISI